MEGLGYYYITISCCSASATTCVHTTVSPFVGAPLAKTGEFVDHYEDDGAQEEVFIE